MKQFKTSLEKGSKLSRAFKKELAASEELTTEVHDELMRRENAKISKDVDNELSWIKVSWLFEFPLLSSSSSPS